MPVSDVMIVDGHAISWTRVREERRRMIAAWKAAADR
jgi:hypothetical protein